MIAKQLLDEISSKVSETLANSPAKDLEKNAKAMLHGAFNKMDLVTREEFDIQQQVLIKTRLKLSELESRLLALEARLAVEQAVAEVVAEESLNANTSETVQANDATESHKPKKSRKSNDKSEA